MGIQVLHRPANGTAEVDIVAVHGLQGDVFKTWTSNSDEKVCWLGDPGFLPRFQPQARVLSWGYNANVLALKGKTTSRDRILQHAQTLIAELAADRDLENASDRPIIFLCHSLGGIVVKRALAYSASRTASNISYLHSIFTCTYGIMFFGTPHHGSSKASLASTVCKLVKVTMPSLSIESDLVSALEEGSEILQNISDQFCPLMARFRIFFFWEQEKSDLGPLQRKDYVVSEASAAPILDNTERCGIAADHNAMCKFVTPSDQGFRTVMAALKRYIRDAPALVSVRRDRERESLLQQRRDEAMENLGLYNNPSGLYHFTTPVREQVHTANNAPRGDEMRNDFANQIPHCMYRFEDEREVSSERSRPVYRTVDNSPQGPIGGYTWGNEAYGRVLRHHLLTET